jgi:FkbM family methyltransferase
MNDDINRPLVSYAQNREDLYLWALVGHRTPGFYVDVGCNHERLHSVTRLFYDRGWSGINIDANPLMEQEYAVRDRDQFVASGVGEVIGQMVFRQFQRHDGLSTFDDDVKALYVDQGHRFTDVVMPVRPLAEILSNASVTHVDFLKIDVEGLEAAVLKGLDLGVVRPAVIVVEASRLDQCNEILFPAGYRIEFFDGLNTYYVDQTQDGISIHNYAGQVLHAGFYTAEEQRLRAELDSLRHETHPVQTWIADQVKHSRSRLRPLRSWATELVRSGARSRRR